jgi:GntR family transcriptional regulator
MAAQEPHWERIAAELRTEILSGVRRPGSQLPPSEQLKELYGTSRQTLQNAVNRLKDEDLIEARSGVGWFVRRPRSVRLIRSSSNWHDRNARPADGLTADWNPRIKIDGEVTRAASEVAHDLEVTPGIELWLRHRIVLNGDQVLHIGLAYLPRKFTRGTSIENNGTKSGTYATLDRAGHKIERFCETIAVRPANEAEATILGLDTRRPSAVLCITRIAHGATCPLEVDYITAPAGRLALVYELPAFG